MISWEDEHVKGISGKDTCWRNEVNKGGKCVDVVKRAQTTCGLVGAFCINNLNAATTWNLVSGTIFEVHDPRGHWYQFGWAWTRASSNAVTTSNQEYQKLVIQGDESLNLVEVPKNQTNVKEMFVKAGLLGFA